MSATYDFESNGTSGFTANKWAASSTADHVQSGTYGCKCGAYGSTSRDLVLSYTVPAGGATVTFYRKVRIIAGYGHYEFSIDGVFKEKVNIASYGQEAWVQKTYYLAPGTRTLRWRVVEDLGNDDTADYAAVDDIVVTDDSSAGSGNLVAIEAVNENCIFSSESNFALDASGDRMGWIVTAPKTMVVDRIALCFDSKTGTPPTYRYSLYNIDPAGTGVPWTIRMGATGNATATFQPSAVSNDSFHEVVLSESVSFAAGEKFAIVIEYSSGTINASNLANYRAGLQNLTANYDFGTGYSLTNAGSWSKNTNNYPVVLFGDGTNWFGVPFSGLRTTRSFSTSTNPSEYGLKFTAPAFGSLGSYKIRGIRLGLALAVTTNTSTINLNLYSGGGASDTTVTKTTSIDTDCFLLPASFTAKDLLFDGPAPIVTVGSTYRISFTSGSTASHSIYTLPLTSAAHVKALGWGSTFCRTDRAGGNWTDTDTQVPLVYALLVEDLEGVQTQGRRVGPSILVG